MRRLAIVALVALFLGCQQPPAPGPAPVGSLTLKLKAEGDALAARGDYEAAAVKYQQAANQEPEDVSVRYALGTALSRLNRREETAQQFTFVVVRGQPNSPEVEAARRWLMAAGEFSESLAVSPSAVPQTEVSPAPVATPPSSPQPPVPSGTVRGKTELKGEPREIRVVMISQDESKRKMGLTQTVKLGESFAFDSVPAGTYRLMVQDSEGDSVLWDLEVTVAPGKETALDLK